MSNPILAFRLFPPDGIYAKFRYYSRRYGLIHAIASYIGRHHLGFWKIVGPTVTSGYLRRWLESSGPHILNLGGGGVLADRWLTGDIDPRADVFMNLMEKLPLPTGSLDVIYSEEVIEHINEDAGRRMLEECYRVLKHGGTLRLTTPSLDYFASQVSSSTRGAEQINQVFYGHGHCHIYSEDSMSILLNELGFRSIKKSSYRDENSKYGYFDSHPERFTFAPPEWSQYWEVEK